MLTKSDLVSKYGKLRKRWEEVSGKNYQKVNKRLMNAVNAINAIDDRPDDTLLDIGCNNGLLSVVASYKFGSVVGIDTKKDVVQKAKITAKVFGRSNCKFKAMKLSDYFAAGNHDGYGVTGVLACQVLYHLHEDDVICLLKLLEKSRVVILGTRPNQGHSNNKRGLYTIQSVSDIIPTRFSTVRVTAKSTTWPVIYAY